MKSRMFGVLSLLIVGSLLLTPATAHAKGNKGKRAIPASLLEKYDTNKDGKLSKKEKANMSPSELAMLPAKKAKKAN
jgi:hypothetical protein